MEKDASLMSVADPSSVDDLVNAIVDFDDAPLKMFVYQMSEMCRDFCPKPDADPDEYVHDHDKADPKMAAVFRALMILGAEEEDRRKQLNAHAERELDGDAEVGVLVSDMDPADFTDEPPA